MIQGNQSRRKYRRFIWNGFKGLHTFPCLQERSLWQQVQWRAKVIFQLYITHSFQLTAWELDFQLLVPTPHFASMFHTLYKGVQVMQPPRIGMPAMHGSTSNTCTQSTTTHVIAHKASSNTSELSFGMGLDERNSGDMIHHFIKQKDEETTDVCMLPLDLHIMKVGSPAVINCPCQVCRLPYGIVSAWKRHESTSSKPSMEDFASLMISHKSCGQAGGIRCGI